MIEEIKALKSETEDKITAIKNKEELENFRLEYLVKKGKVQALLDRMKDVPKEDKPVVGKELNILRKFVESSYKDLKEKFENESLSTPDIDLTLPGRRGFKGSYHPINTTIDQMIDIFSGMGFTVAEGPEIEDDFHNFDALNFPPDHPARDLQDTFFMDNERKYVLRTHTSPVQIRLMQLKEPPIRSIMPGRVYRNEALDATHLAEFHQIEGLYIDKKVTLAELKATMITFAQKMYGENLEHRFRASFFPFTEPSAELDVRRPDGKWMEVAGCGMVHPNVLKAGGIDPEVYSGYAFGIGIERVTMLRTKLDDIRRLHENDKRVLVQL